MSSMPFAAAVPNVEQEAQRVCSRYTEDPRVFVVSTYLLTSSLADCLVKHDTVAVNNFYPLDDATVDRHRSHYYGPGAATTDCALTAAVKTFSDERLPRRGRRRHRPLG